MSDCTPLTIRRMQVDMPILGDGALVVIGKGVYVVRMPYGSSPELMFVRALDGQNSEAVR